MNYIVLHPDPHVLKHIRIPEFDKPNDLHVRLAHKSMATHNAVIDQNIEEVEVLEKEIDSTAAEIWGMDLSELLDVQNSLRELS